MKNKSWIQIAVFLLFIVVIPLGSYYYLKRGYDYRKDAMKQMQHLGPLPQMDFMTVDGRRIVSDSLQGMMVIADVISLQNKAQADQFGEYMVKLYDQFEETSRLVLLAFGKDPQYDGQAPLLEFAKKYNLDNKPYMYWIPADSSGMDRVIERLYFPEGNDNDYPYFVLCDTSLTVQNHYPLSDASSIREMVTHTAMFLPLKPRKRVVFRRETEK